MILGTVFDMVLINILDDLEMMGHFITGNNFGTTNYFRILWCLFMVYIRILGCLSIKHFGTMLIKMMNLIMELCAVESGIFGEKKRKKKAAVTMAVAVLYVILKYILF